MLNYKERKNIIDEINKYLENKPFYNGENLLLKKDIDGKLPIMNLITSNRSAGKTSYFLMFSWFLKKLYNKKTVFFYRYSYELSESDKIFTDIIEQYGFGEKTKSVKIIKDLLYEIFIDEESIGYAVRISNVDSLKKFSPIFAGVELCIMDEFQTESGVYLKKEVEKMQSILYTISRGGGEQSREVLTILIGNPVTIMNPYYINLGIHKRLTKDVHFLRGKRYVAEFTVNNSSKQAIAENGLTELFDSSYSEYSQDGNFLINSESFIEKPNGKSRYLFTIIYDGDIYGVREFLADGIVHVSNKPDMTCNNILVFKPNDHTQNTILLKRACYTWSFIRDAFDYGKLRFSDIKTKDVIFDILAIDMYK